MQGRMAKLRRDTRALSPIFAVLLLIAITVIGGIIVYMYTSGYLATMVGGGTAGQEKAAIQAVNASATTQKVIVWAKVTGGGPVVIKDVILRDATGNTIAVVTLTSGVTLKANGDLEKIEATFAASTMVSGYTYTVALVSTAGGQFVSASFKAQ